MANTLLSAIATASTPPLAGTELLYLSASGVDQKCTVANLFTSSAVVSPVITTGCTASGSASNDFSASTGTFKTSSGANQLSGAVTIADAATPSLTTASGKTNTGFVQINGKTSGALKLLPVDAAGQTVTVSLAAQTVGAATLTIPDFASVADTFVFATKAATLASKTLTAPVINGATSASGNFDLSGSTGTFLTSTGANTLSGAVTVADATTPSITLATGKTNTGFLLINGKTSGSLKVITADATAQAVTISCGAQTSGAAILSLPDFAGVNDTFVFATKSATLANKTFTAPVLGVATGTSLAVTGLITSSGTAGIGYATGAGGTVSQATDRTTAVTLNKTTGQITTQTTSLAAGAAVSFTVNNSTVAATDTVVVSVIGGGTGLVSAHVTSVGSGSFQCTLRNNHASTAATNADVVNFAVIKGVSA